MSIFDDCLSVEQKEKGLVCMTAERDTPLDLLVQDVKLPFSEKSSNLRISYISDIHLENRILNAFPAGASDNQILVFIDSLVDSLLSDEIAHYESRPLVLFGGDIASSFELSKEFYCSFMRKWAEKNKADYDKKRAAIVPLVSERETIWNEVDTWKSKRAWTKTAIKDLLEYSDRRVPESIKALIRRERELQSQIYSYTWNPTLYTTEWKLPFMRVFSVIGNHEFWPFDSADDCYNAYQTLFDTLNIRFLNNKSFCLNNYGEKVQIIGGNRFCRI